MSQHVFITWDFVNLIKALHSQLTATQPPWFPTRDPEAVRLLYEILIEEETDTDPNQPGQHGSHLAFYLLAMQHCGADTQPFQSCIDKMQQGELLDHALAHPAILPCTQQFVKQTFAVCEQATLPALAAYFVFGREAMVPHLFKPWLAQLQQTLREDTVWLEYYLKRHIELDSQSHFPKAANMLSNICGNNTGDWQVAKQAAKEALQARLAFLDGMYQASWGLKSS